LRTQRLFVEVNSFYIRFPIRPTPPNSQVNWLEMNQVPSQKAMLI